MLEAAERFELSASIEARRIRPLCYAFSFLLTLVRDAGIEPASSRLKAFWLRGPRFRHQQKWPHLLPETWPTALAHRQRNRGPIEPEAATVLTLGEAVYLGRLSG